MHPSPGPAFYNYFLLKTWQELLEINPAMKIANCCDAGVVLPARGLQMYFYEQVYLRFLIFVMLKQKLL